MSAQYASGNHSDSRLSVACREPFDTRLKDSWTPSLCIRRCETRVLVVKGPTLARDTEVNTILSGRLHSSRRAVIMCPARGTTAYALAVDRAHESVMAEKPAKSK